MKTILRFLLRILFGFRSVNDSVLCAPGPVLLLPNHTSWFDWVFLVACIDTRWKFVTSRQTAQTSWFHRLMMINRFTFPVDSESPYAVKHMAEYLQKGGRLVLFPEGRLSQTGSLMKLFDGTGFLLFKTNAKVITCYLRGAYRLPFSPNPNHKRWFPRVTAHFSELLTPPQLHDISTTRARYRLTRWLYDLMVRQQCALDISETPGNVLENIIEAARNHPSRVVLQDFTMAEITYRRLLAGVDVLASHWETLLPSCRGQRVAVLLPNTSGMPLTILSLWAVDIVPAILNYSTGVPSMLVCAQLANIKHLITARAFLQKARIDIQPMIDAGLKIIYLEDVRAKITPVDRIAALAHAMFHPRSIIRVPPVSEAAVILFTSGSEGPPKAVELTHRNLLSNIRQMLSIVDLTEADRICNALPLFHSFGLTIGLLLPLVRGGYTFLYPSPLHYRVIPTVFYNLNCTVFFGTNTFLNGYARKAHPYDFRSLRYLFAGAEKLQTSTADTWSRRFGARVLEGYGATECSPCVTANTPINPRFGSAGRFLPGIEYRIESIEGVAEGGRLFVRGPNIMRGYLNPDANAKFKALNGWYDTGDIAHVDEDGFLFILGRMKRFAKISGEMVSLTAVEEALAGAFPQYGLRCEIAVLARPDADRGESLVAVANDSKLKLEDLRPVIKSKGLSNLCMPRELKYVRDIPKLGTGKVNHRELQKLLYGT